MSPEKLELNNGLVIKLLGIKTKASYLMQATEYLKEKFKKHKVYIKFDSIKYDNNNNLLCYIYLDNKTFINRHLLKTGYVDLDSSVDFKYKNIFMEDIRNAKGMDFKQRNQPFST